MRGIKLPVQKSGNGGFAMVEKTAELQQTMRNQIRPGRSENPWNKHDDVALHDNVVFVRNNEVNNAKLRSKIPDKYKRLAAQNRIRLDLNGIVFEENYKGEAGKTYVRIPYVNLETNEEKELIYNLDNRG